MINKEPIRYIILNITFSAIKLIVNLGKMVELFYNVFRDVIRLKTLNLSFFNELNSQHNSQSELLSHFLIY